MGLTSILRKFLYYLWNEKFSFFYLWNEICIKTKFIANSTEFIIVCTAAKYSNDIKIIVFTYVPTL